MESLPRGDGAGVTALIWGRWRLRRRCLGRIALWSRFGHGRGIRPRTRSHLTNTRSADSRMNAMVSARRRTVHHRLHLIPKQNVVGSNPITRSTENRIARVETPGCGGPAYVDGSPLIAISSRTGYHRFYGSPGNCRQGNEPRLRLLEGPLGGRFGENQAWKGTLRTLRSPWYRPGTRIPLERCMSDEEWTQMGALRLFRPPEAEPTPEDVTSIGGPRRRPTAAGHREVLRVAANGRTGDVYVGPIGNTRSGWIVVPGECQCMVCSARGVPT